MTWVHPEIPPLALEEVLHLFDALPSEGFHRLDLGGEPLGTQDVGGIDLQVEPARNAVAHLRAVLPDLLEDGALALACLESRLLKFLQHRGLVDVTLVENFLQVSRVLDLVLPAENPVFEIPETGMIELTDPQRGAGIDFDALLHRLGDLAGERLRRRGD